MFDKMWHQETKGEADAVADDVAEERGADDDPAPAAVGRWRNSRKRQKDIILIKIL